MLDPVRLTILRAVVESGSMNRTAQRLAYTPSAVSQHISALQRETGLQLLERVGRGVVPTPAGRALAQEAEKVLAALGELDATVEALRAGRESGLSIACFATAGSRWMPTVITALSAEFPQVRIRLQLEETLTGVDRRRPDVAVVVQTAKGAPVPTGYSQFEVMTEPYLVVVPAAHPLAAEESVPMAALADQPWIDNDRHAGPCRQNTMDACAAAGFSPRFVIETTDYPSAIAFVERGMGITVVPRLGASPLPSGVVAVGLTDPSPTRRVAVQMKNQVAAQPIGRRFAELLTEASRVGAEPGAALVGGVR